METARLHKDDSDSFGVAGQAVPRRMLLRIMLEPNDSPDLEHPGRGVCSFRFAWFHLIGRFLSDGASVAVLVWFHKTPLAHSRVFDAH